MASGYLSITGTGLRLPGARGLAELGECLLAERELTGSRRRLDAEDTDLPPVDVLVGLCDEPGPVPSRQARSRPAAGAGLSRESRLAVVTAAEALARRDGDGQPIGVVWASSTAGLAEYGQICVEAATLEPGQASPLVAPRSAYNGPAAAVSIELNLTGPQLTLTGDRDAGASALVEAARLVEQGRCRQVLVGGSAAVSRWRLDGAVPDAGRGTEPAAAQGVVPAEGAVCLLLSRPAGDGRAGVRALRRSRLRGSPGGGALPEFVAGCLTRMGGPPDAIAISAAPAWCEPAERVVRARGVPCWFVDRIGGDVGAAGGLVAVVAALAGCGPAATGGSRVLALAVGGASDAVAVEIVSVNS